MIPSDDRRISPLDASSCMNFNAILLLGLMQTSGIKRNWSNVLFCFFYFNSDTQDEWVGCLMGEDKNVLLSRTKTAGDFSDVALAFRCLIVSKCRN